MSDPINYDDGPPEEEIVEIILPGNQVLDVIDPAAVVRLGVPLKLRLEDIEEPFGWCRENCKSAWSYARDEVTYERVFSFADINEAFHFKFVFHEPFRWRP